MAIIPFLACTQAPDQHRRCQLAIKKITEAEDGGVAGPGVLNGLAEEMLARYEEKERWRAAIRLIRGSLPLVSLLWAELSSRAPE